MKLVLCWKCKQQDPRRPRYRIYTHERGIYRGTIDGKVALLCRQVDDITLACFDPTVVQGLIAALACSDPTLVQGLIAAKSYCGPWFHAIGADIVSCR
jgi:hypothetical protein